MSAKTLMLRDLAVAASCDRRVVQAVTDAIRTVLPEVIEGILQQQYPGEQISLYIAKKPATMRRERDAALRMEFNGRNAQALAKKYGVSVMTVWRAVK